MRGQCLLVCLAILGLSAACGTHRGGVRTSLPPLPKATFVETATEIEPTATVQPLPSPTKTASVTPCPVIEAGGLISELDRIAALQPGPDTQGMAIPTDAQLAAWQNVLRAVESGDTLQACSLLQASVLPYQLVRFTDLPFHDEQVLLLREIEPLTVGWGTYVYRTQAARDVVIEVPHPLEDSYTRGEGITFFRELGAKALLVAGAHRCANAESSTCGGTTIACGQVEPYRTSDVAHSVRTMFHAAHRVWADCRGDTIVIQLHGNDIDTCPDVFVSNGTRHPGDLARALQRNAARMCKPFSVDVADGSPADECGFVGNGPQAASMLTCTAAAQTDACPDAPTRPNGPDRYLSIEQSMALRQDFTCLVAALKATLP